MKFFDDSTREINWKNRNYFFAGSFAIAVITIILFAALGKCWPSAIFEPKGPTTGMRNFWVSLLAPFSYLNWLHAISGAIILFVCGIYIERKWGTFSYLGILFMLWMLGCLCTQVTCGLGISAGSSMVYYGMYAFILIDFLFSFQKSRRSIGNIITGVLEIIFAVIMTSLYSENAGIKGVTFKFMRGFFTDPAHTSSFFAGLFLAIILYAIVFIRQKKI